MLTSEQIGDAFVQALQGLIRNGGTSYDERLIVAVSGGPDSLCLLHFLCQGDFYPRDQLLVAHLNHELRDSAETEAAFVTAFATEYGVRTIVKKQDVGKFARNQGLSVEEAGRYARYHFFADVARENKAQYVVTGHNADDQVETILMHFLRGSAMSGLLGMQISAPLPGSPDLTLIRPLLPVSRSSIDSYCAKNELIPVIDESNQDRTYYRNRIRHELIPLLEEYNPGVRERLRKMALILSDEDSLLEGLNDHEWDQLFLESGPGWLTLDRTAWQRTPIALQRRVIRRAVHSLVPNLRNVGFRTTEQAREVASTGAVGAISVLPAGVSLEVDYKHLSFVTEDGGIPKPNLPQLTSVGEYALDLPGRLVLKDGWVIQAQIVDEIDSRLVFDNRDPWQAYLSMDETAGITVRTRRRGERFRPMGMSGRTAKVSQVMINRKIPARMRAKWPILASEKHLFWVVGHHIDERVRVGPDCHKVLLVKAFREVDG